ncbi:ABC transporter permease [Actinomycetospora lutea]|uniref:ABC transporter permease n=1 Tax=Actinomycetospora lutea TaxID=663604 RepID=UPI00236700B9|nr:ABC transporter permease [Actinomycetospora lutea]MDD7941427.1 ABC transporter permease [Actinomycetospora lutea]
MVAYAGWTARRRSPEVPRLLPIAAVSFLAASAVTMLVIFGLGVLPLSSRTLVPIAGLIIGNAMTATVLVGRRLVGSCRTSATRWRRASPSAGLVQAVVIFLVLAAAATTTTVVALGVVRRLFTPDHRLVVPARTSA